MPSYKVKRASVPTAEEINTLRETQELFKSNLFKLQLDELYKEVRVVDAEDSTRSNKIKLLEEYLHKLKQCLDSLEAHDISIPASETVLGCKLRSLQPASSSSSEKKAKTELAFKFQPPARVDLVGSYLLKTVTRPLLNIDLAIQMPKPSFFDKDYLNFRYFDKRAAYLAEVKSHLEKHDLFSTVEVAYLHDDPLKPILTITPPSDVKGKLLQKFIIRVLPSIDADTFILRRLAPTRNCVRQAYLPSSSPSSPPSSDTSKKGKKASEKADSKDKPTPYYNQAIVEDMFHRQHVESLYAISSECPSFVQAVILLKTWARQRGLFDSNAQQKQDKTKTSTKNNKKSNKRQKTGKQGKKSGAAGTTNILTLGYVLNGFTLTMILAHLMSVRKVNKQMSSYQMFKVALQFLAEGHLTSSKGGVQMLTTSSGKGDSDDEDRASSTASAYVSSLSMTSYTRAFDNVLIDPFGLNILFRLSEAAMSSAVHEAKLSLKCLDDSLRDGFTPLFMTPIDTTLKYDVYLNITLSALSPSASPTTSDLPPPSSQTPFIYPKYPTMDERSALCRQVYSVLKQGLNNRVRLISSSLTSTATKQNNTITMQVGLLLDPNHAFRPIEMGPAADDDKRAKKFRAFWGEKAELRRFRDGQIVEAAVFTTAPHMKHTIVHMISEYLLRRHITHKTVEKVAFIGNQLDSVLQLNKSAFSNAAAHSLSPNNIAPYLTNPNTAVPLIESSFKVLVARIRSLASVPLSITSILPSHSSTYFSAPFPPFPVPHSSSSSPSSSSSTDPEYSLQRETPSSTSGTQDFSQALTPIDVVLTFETSNLWPDDLVAISRIKSAFLIKIATALTDKFNDISTSTGLDFIDVVVTQNASSSTPSRFAFRVRIYHDREIMIRRQDKRLGNPSPTIPYTMSDISEMERVLVNRPIHASSMKGFVGRHPLFSNACRLVKRWLASHMLLACFEEEAVELMVAHCFTQSLPYSKPSSSLQGLCRFLHLLSSFDFYSSPLVVDLAHVADVAVDDAEKQGVQKMDDEAIEEMAHNDVTAKVYNDIMAAFDSARANGSGAPLYIATHRDIKSQHWTSASKPSQNEFARAIKFAKSSLKHISSLVTSSLSSSSSSSLTASVFKTAFKTPLNIYDVVIRVDREALPFSAQHQRLFDYTESLPPLPSKRSDDDVEGMFGGDGSDNDIMQMLLNEKKEKKKKKKFKAPPTVNDVIQSNMAYMKSQNDDDDDETVALFKSKPLVGFNAVDCYINDLKLRLEDVADIYYNEFDKSIICLSWKSKYVKTLSTSASTSKGSKRMRDQSTTSTTITPIECDFTVARCVYTTPLSTSKQGEYVGINIPEIIHDIKLMGQGIVNDVVMMN